MEIKEGNKPWNVSMFNQTTLIELMIPISGEFRIGFSYLQETMDFHCSDSKVILANPSNNAGPIYYHF